MDCIRLRKPTNWLRPILVLSFLAYSAFGVGGQEADTEAKPPEKYILDYPTADACCPPIRSTFMEVTRTWGVVQGRRFRQKPNGGYGLPVVDTVDGKHLLHVGADLGWYQVGEPVFAVAGGVVRVSTGPDFKHDDHHEADGPRRLPWGNLVVIEHRFGKDQYVTTVYGHLGTQRLVEAGDLVQAGQQIGTIGRQHFRINGGYKPHLHLGVREGRMAEVGSVLLQMRINGQPGAIKLAALGEEQIEIELPEGAPSTVGLTLNGRRFVVETLTDRRVAPARLLWEIQSPDFPLVGYALSTDGWRDPIRFLREHNADSNPAPLQLDPRAR